MLWNQTNTHILRFHGWGDVSADPRLSSCISLQWLRHVESGHQSMCVLHLTGPRPWTSCPYCALVKDNQISYSNKPRLDFLGVYVRKRRKNSNPCSRRRICLLTAATLTKMLLERHRERLDLVCLRATTSNIRVLFFVFFRRQPSESLHLIAYVRNANPSLPPCEPLTWVAMVSKPRIRRSMWQHVVKVQHWWCDVTFHLDNSHVSNIALLHWCFMKDDMYNNVY